MHGISNYLEYSESCIYVPSYKSITDALDDCLCTDEQIGEYRQAILDAIAAYYAQ